MINRILAKFDHRYISATERSELLRYLPTVKARYTAIQELKNHVNAVADYVVVEMKRRYPQFTQSRPQGFEKTRRDIAILTAFAGNAMFIGETETMDDQFTYWFKTILKSVHLSPQCASDAFDAWKNGLKSLLSDDSYLLIKPMAEHLATVLTDLPEPVRHEDGLRSKI